MIGFFLSAFLTMDYRLILALFFSVLLHMTALLSIHHLNILTPLAKDSPPRLEIILLPKKKRATHPKAQQPDLGLLAQAKTKAGDTSETIAPPPPHSTSSAIASTARKKRANETSPSAKVQKPVPLQTTPPLQPVQEKTPHQARSNLSTLDSGSSKALAPPQPSAQELIAALEGRIAKGFPLSSEQPRKRHLDFRTKDYTAVAYLDAWCKKIERVGKMNYPEQAKRQGLSGSLSLVVDLNPDGSLANIVVRRSSGYPLLDEAAVRIVQLAAPFAKVPESILQGHDILSITRRWQFHSNTDFRAH
jgi:periplasmic protein TonB